MKKYLLLLYVLLLLLAPGADASLTEFRTFSENGAGISIDAVGLETGTEGSVQAKIPTGAVVEAAWLYSAEIGYGNGLHDVIFEGTRLTSDASSRLDGSPPPPELPNPKEANSWVSENRWDVTSIVRNKFESGAGSGQVDFSVIETGNLDGEILAVLYSVESQPYQTAFIFDGELATTGDTFNIYLTDEFDGSPAIFSQGISYGYQGTSQYTQVNVNGLRLTTSAGGQDDGSILYDGGLITAGGIGDSLDNPPDPYAEPDNDPGYDDELYNLASLLTLGDTLITIDTFNPSNDDNVFFAALVVNGEASVGPGPGPAPVPEPATILLLSTGLLGFAARLRRKLKK